SDLSRPNSSPARLSQNTLLAIRCCGAAWATALSSRPRSRRISMARWLAMWARGVSASHPYLVTRTCFTPYIASKAADAAPAGPLPTTRTSVSIVWVIAVSQANWLCVALSVAPSRSFRGRHHRLRYGSRPRLHLEFVGHDVPGPRGRLAIRHHRLVVMLDFRNQFVFDTEDGIGIQILVAFDK